MRAAILRSSVAVAVAVATALTAAGPAGAAPRPVTVVELGTLGGPSSSAVAINERGQVAGSSDTADGARHAFVWHRGVMTDLGTLGGRDSFANDISERGDVVGVSDRADGTRHAFLWRRGVMTDLGTLGGTTSNAFFVDSRGQVVGQSSTDGDSDFEMFVWRDGVMRRLGSLGGPPVFATAMSDRGHVVGFGGDAAGVTRAFRWARGVMTDLGSLTPGGFSQAADVNERGQVAGIAERPEDGGFEPVLWSRGRITRLGTLGGEFGQAYAVNERGSVVGSSATATGAGHAFLWRRGVMTDLETGTGSDERIGWDVNDKDEVLVESRGGSETRFFLWRRGTATPLPGLGPGLGVDARQLNDRGQIAGTAFTADGLDRAVLWRS